MKLREYLGVSGKRQRQFTKLMQLLLLIAVIGGFYLGNTGIIVNSLVSLAISFLPALLERDYEIVMDPALALWLTLAVFLHAVGTYGPYRIVWWWDHLTHVLSSSVVAGAGYIAVRALDEHYDQIKMPGRFMFVFLLIFVMTFGVIWELIEFGISGLADILGLRTVLTQYGLEDTLKDLVFDTVGGLLVAVLGSFYLEDFVGQIRKKLQNS